MLIPLGLNLHRVAIKKIVLSPPPILEGKWSKEFKEFVSKCLVKNPDKRWTSAAALQHDFVRKAPAKKVLRWRVQQLEKGGGLSRMLVGAGGGWMNVPSPGALVSPNERKRKGSVLSALPILFCLVLVLGRLVGSRLCVRFQAVRSDATRRTAVRV
jgi:serine/threonine protein kinase